MGHHLSFSEALPGCFAKQQRAMISMCVQEREGGREGKEEGGGREGDSKAEESQSDIGRVRFILGTTKEVFVDSLSLAGSILGPKAYPLLWYQLIS